MVGMVVALCFAGAGGAATAAPSAPNPSAAVAEAKIEKMRSTFAATMKAYQDAADDLAATRAKITAHTERVKVLDGSIAKNRARLAAEARFLYRTSGVGFVEILLGSASIEEFMNRSAALKRVTSRDAATVQRLAEERKERREVFADLRAREKRQGALVARLAAQRARAQAALDAQQRYVDSLPAPVTAALDSQRSARNSTPPAKPKGGSTGGVVPATVAGRSGTYAVLSGQPTSYRTTGLAFNGVATWYGNVRPNMSTASGRAFDENELTCAHKTLPFGTRVAVTFRGKSVIVTVTDRGPYGQGRVIDLTKRAAGIIGLKSAGVGQVRCEVVTPAR